MKSCVLKAVLVLITVMSMTSFGSTVAHWNMADAGAANGAYMPGNASHGADVNGDGVKDKNDFLISSRDLSGNGNHLSTWTSSWMKWTNDSPAGDFAMVNTNNYPDSRTDSAWGMPTGIDVQTITPAQWTVEAVFKSTNLSSNRTIVGRDGKLGGNQAPLYLSTRGTNMAIEFTDVSGIKHTVTVAAGLTTNTWYKVAAVSDSTTLSLYLDGILRGSLDMTGSSADTSLALGTGVWTVALGMWNGGAADRFLGSVDEVAISNAALAPGSFVTPEPATLVLLGLGTLTMIGKRK